MAALGVLRTVEGARVAFYCPGCRCAHMVTVGPGFSPGAGPRWNWNGSYARPTFSPSILVTGTQPLTGEERAAVMRGEAVEPRPLVCHSFVEEGSIRFLSDSTHHLAGQTVPLEPPET